MKAIADSNVSGTPFTYTYLPNASLIDTLTSPNGMVQDRNWDDRGLLSSITTRDIGGNVLRKFQYGLNALGQRESVTREDNSVLSFGYDARRQVTSGQKTAAGTSFPGFDYRYQYDEIGNRKAAGTSADPAATTYAVNPLNQYTSIAQAALVANPAYDLNGSLLNDGRNVLTWDERNQLKTLTQTSTGETLLSRYDAAGRRTEAQELSSTDIELRKIRYLYDGWNCVAEFEVNPTSGSLSRLKTHTWGLDVSQTSQGAGGVGGLLATADERDGIKKSYYFAYDGNGNVVALYGQDLNLAASYEYDPFGNGITASGPYAQENRYRFSTKPQERIGGLYYYGYRYYNPVTGRWPSRDPIEEEGGMNIFHFIFNDAQNKYDFLGLVAGGRGIITTPMPTMPERTTRRVGGANRPPPKKDGPLPTDVRPGSHDAYNPDDSINTGKENYTDWFEYRFPITIKGAQEKLQERIGDGRFQKELGKEDPTSFPGLTGPLDDIDIDPNNPTRFKDKSGKSDPPQTLGEKWVVIGFFEVRTDDIKVLKWRRELGKDGKCYDCFDYETTIYVRELTGSNDTGIKSPGDLIRWMGMTYQREVRMAEWKVFGTTCK